MLTTTCFLSSILGWPPKKLSFSNVNIFHFQRWIFFRDKFFPSWRLLTFWQHKTGRFLFVDAQNVRNLGSLYIFLCMDQFLLRSWEAKLERFDDSHLIDGSMKHETLVGFLPIWIHGTGIVTHMSLIVMVNAGKYTIHEILVRFFTKTWDISKKERFIPIGSTWLVYLPTFAW